MDSPPDSGYGSYVAPPGITWSQNLKARTWPSYSKAARAVQSRHPLCRAHYRIDASHAKLSLTSMKNGWRVYSLRKMAHWKGEMHPRR